MPLAGGHFTPSPRAATIRSCRSPSGSPLFKGTVESLFSNRSSRRDLPAQDPHRRGRGGGRGDHRGPPRRPSPRSRRGAASGAGPGLDGSREARAAGDVEARLRDPARLRAGAAQQRPQRGGVVRIVRGAGEPCRPARPAHHAEAGGGALAGAGAGPRHAGVAGRRSGTGGDRRLAATGAGVERSARASPCAAARPARHRRLASADLPDAGRDRGGRRVRSGQAARGNRRLPEGDRGHRRSASVHHHGGGGGSGSGAPGARRADLRPRRHFLRHPRGAAVRHAPSAGRALDRARWRGAERAGAGPGLRAQSGRRTRGAVRPLQRRGGLQGAFRRSLPDALPVA